MLDIPAVELVLDAKDILGEGAIWDSRAGLLYWLDIEGGLVHIHDPKAGSQRVIEMDENATTIVPRKSGGAMVTLERGFASMDMDTGRREFLAGPSDEPKGHRFNDGKCDPAGRFWAGTIGSKGGALYRLDRDLSLHRMFGDVKCSNGIAWSLDRKTMYYIDTPTGYVEAWDYDDATGVIANRRVAVKIPKENGHPDGCTLDSDGNLWVAHWEGWNVTCYDPRNGAQLKQIRLPVSLVTSVAFGGDDLGTLYITSARSGLKEDRLKKEPLAGGLFKCRPGAKGIPAPEFGG